MCSTPWDQSPTLENGPSEHVVGPRETVTGHGPRNTDWDWSKRNSYWAWSKRVFIILSQGEGEYSLISLVI